MIDISIFQFVVTRQTPAQPSSVTYRAPSSPTVTPTGRPQTCPSAVTIQLEIFVLASGFAVLQGDAMTFVTAASLRFQDPCSPREAITVVLRREGDLLVG